MGLLIAVVGIAQAEPSRDAARRAGPVGYLDATPQVMAQAPRNGPDRASALFAEAERLQREGRIASGDSIPAEGNESLVADSGPAQEDALAESGWMLRKVLLAVSAGAIVAWILMRIGRASAMAARVVGPGESLTSNWASRDDQTQ